MAIINLGKLPKYLYLDNGKAFKAKVFTHDLNLEECGLYGMFGRLGIHTTFADFYKARSKSIERFWGTLSDSFERLLPSFIGASIPDRPASLNRNEKFMAANFPRRIPDIPEVYQWLKDWQGYYLNMAHPNPFRRGKEGQKLTRGQVFDEGRGPGVNEEELNFMMMSMEIRTIRQNGIHFLGRNYWNENLYGLKDRVVIRYSWENVGSRIYVYDRNGGYLGRANRIEPVHPMAAMSDNPAESYTEIKEGIKTQNRMVKTTKKVFALAKAQGRKASIDQVTWDEMIKIDPMLPDKIEKFEGELQVQGSMFNVQGSKEEIIDNPDDTIQTYGSEPECLDPEVEPYFEYGYEKYEWLVGLPSQSPDQVSWMEDYRSGRIFPGEWQKIFGRKAANSASAIFD
jgi:putative transposase